LLTKQYPLLDTLLESDAVELIFSNELLNEFVSVVQRPKFYNFLLALAQDSQADYLVTGDKDLLSLDTFGKTRIITMSVFKML
jgi:predicted nucleic acid-binding protein